MILELYPLGRLYLIFFVLRALLPVFSVEILISATSIQKLETFAFLIYDASHIRGWFLYVPKSKSVSSLPKGADDARGLSKLIESLVPVSLQAAGSNSLGRTKPTAVWGSKYSARFGYALRKAT